MSITKGQLAERVLRAIGINTRYSEADATEVLDVLYMAEDWFLSHNAMGRRLGWYQADGIPDPNETTGIPDWAVMGATYALAEMVCPYFEKQFSPAMAQLKASGMRTIINKTVDIHTTQYPSRFPRGQANGSPWQPTFYHPENRIRTHQDFLSDEGDDPLVTLEGGGE